MKIDINNKYNINVIVTYQHKQQDIYDIEVNEYDLLNRVNLLRSIILGKVDDEDVIGIIKVSTSLNSKKMSKEFEDYIYGDKGWMTDCNGKFWIQNDDFSCLYREVGFYVSQHGGDLVKKNSNEYVYYNQPLRIRVDEEMN
jgi:hypothetical protein